MWLLGCLVIGTLVTCCYGQLRLPHLVQPTHYDLRLIPYLDPQHDGDRSFTFDGQVIIRVLVFNTTDYFRIHAHDVDVGELNVSEYFTRENIPILYTDVDGVAQQLEVKMRRPLVAGNQYILHFKYVGNIRPGGRGIARASYFNKEKKLTRWVLYTSFESTYARRAFPCFDEPGFKAHFILRVARKNHTIAVSTMPLSNTVVAQAKTGWVWDSFEETPQIPPYLLSLAVGEWAWVEAPGQLGSRVYVVPGQELRAAVLAEALGPALHTAQDYAIGVQLPPGLLKLDCVVVPDPTMDWAVENWGLLTFGEMMVMLPEDYADAEATEEVYLTVSHEVAHLWFGNMATLRWWDNLWLKEGFASAFQYIITDALKPEWQLRAQFPVSVTQIALRHDVRGGRSALFSQADTPEDIEARYDEVSYLKGSAIIGMLETCLGELLLTGIKSFLQENANNTSGVDLEDLFRAMGNVSAYLPPGQSLADVMLPWVTQAGFPLVTVSRFNATHLVLSQKHFMPPEGESYNWWVPVTYVCASRENNTNISRGLTWLPPKSAVTVPIGRNSCEWFIFNMGHKGYFRVSYSRDLNQWRHLAAVLQQNPQAVPVEGRAQLLDDAFQLSAVGLLPYAASLRLAGSFLSSETNRAPWTVAIRHFSDILAKLRARPGVMKLFMRFLTNLVSPPLSTALRADHSQHGLRVLKSSLSSWACLHLRLCPEMFSSNVTSAPTERLLELSSDPDLLEAVLCSVQRLSDNSLSTHLQQLVDRMRSTDASPFVREHAYNAVACSEDKRIIYQILKAPLVPGGSNISSLGLAETFEYVLQLSSSTTFEAIWMLANDYVHIAPSMIPFFVATLTNVAALKNETEKVRQLANENLEDTSVQESLRELEENEKWIKKNTKSIFEWLKNYKQQKKQTSTGDSVRRRNFSSRKKPRKVKEEEQQILSKRRRWILDEEGYNYPPLNSEPRNSQILIVDNNKVPDVVQTNFEVNQILNDLYNGKDITNIRNKNLNSKKMLLTVSSLTEQRRNKRESKSAKYKHWVDEQELKHPSNTLIEVPNKDEDLELFQVEVTPDSDVYLTKLHNYFVEITKKANLADHRRMTGRCFRRRRCYQSIDPALAARISSSEQK